MKQRINQLAVFGGTPLFDTALVVGAPDLTSRPRMLERIQDALASGWVTNNGPLVRQFETEISRQAGGAHCVAVCNGTMALQMMARACGLTGDVILPAFTFVATAHALEWIGLRPIFADVDPETHTLSVESVKDCITPQTSAILGVHLWGNPCDADALQDVADEHDLHLLFDACHAFGCRQEGRPVGTLGTAEAFSFHATKFVHALEGGAVLTQSAELAERMRLMRNFGITGLSSVESPGVNGKLNDVSAAVGLVSLEGMAERMQHNRYLQHIYRESLQGCFGLQTLDITADDGGNGQYAVALIEPESFGLSRDQLLQILRADGVFARSYFVPGCHRAAPYAGRPEHCPVPLPMTESILTRVLQLPVGPGVSPESARAICQLLNWVQRHAANIRDRLQSGSPLQGHPDDPAAVRPPLPLAG